MREKSNSFSCEDFLIRLWTSSRMSAAKNNNTMVSFLACLSLLIGSFVNGGQSADPWNGLSDFDFSEVEQMPSDFLLTPQLIQKEGYGYENHKLTTPDGYHVRLHRILKPNNRPNLGIPIHFMHGFESTSDMYLLRGRDDDLPYILTDLGYDVWLGDCRGNYYTRSHENLSVNERAFWNFTFHEVGYYDLPTFYDYILEETGYQKLIAVTHSMAVAEFLVFASTHPDYNSKILLAILMAPVASSRPPSDQSPLLRILLPNQWALYSFAKQTMPAEIGPRTAKGVEAIRKFCGDRQTQQSCFDVYGWVYGDHRSNVNKTRFPYQVDHIGASSSLNTASHLGQVYSTGFRMFSYGPSENLRRYGSSNPPYYPLHLITCPVAVIYATNDLLSSEYSALRVARQIPSLFFVKKLQDPQFTHMDYLWGLNSKKILNPHVVGLVESFSNELRRY